MGTNLNGQPTICNNNKKEQSSQRTYPLRSQPIGLTARVLGSLMKRLTNASWCVDMFDIVAQIKSKMADRRESSAVCGSPEVSDRAFICSHSGVDGAGHGSP
jgi:hypothetical protein